MENIVYLVVGLIGGFAMSLVASYWIIYEQFEHGVGGYRMSVVAEATHKFHEEFKKPAGTRITSPIRDKYRYGLGVIIDDLEAMDEHGYKDFGKKVCPCLAENGDRWGRFNDYVRPVVDDINAYSFLRKFSSTAAPLLQLGALMDLCIQIEVVVMHLDAAFDEAPPIAAWKEVPEQGSGEHIVIVGDTTDSRVVVLNEEFVKLKGAWGAWKKSIGIEEQNPVV